LTGTLIASRDVTERKPVIPFFGGITGQNTAETQAPTLEAATPLAPANDQGAAPQAGVPILTILRVLLGIFAAMTLVVTVLRIRRTLRRRRRAQLKKRQMAYARSRQGR
jgi:beta-lactamase regulating signal transducer with metallopeptidase domain